MITIDITTRNTVYHPLSAQGQWIQHRFGRRSYPTIDLDLDTIKLVLEQYDTVFLRSIYGDPLCHPDINTIIDLLEESKKQCIIFSYLNIDDSNLIQRLSTVDNIIVYANIDGFDSYGKTILNSNKELVFKNIKELGKKVTIEFCMYKHNLLDYNNIVKEFDSKINLLPGKKLCDGPTSIINDEGEWLYDVLPANELNEELHESKLVKYLDSYNILIPYRRIIEGKSILNDPVIVRTIRNNKEIFNIDMPAISVTGHLFKCNEYMNIFSNALCNDWNITPETISYVNRVTVAMFNAGNDTYAIRVNTALLDITTEGLSRFCDSNI